MNTIPVTFEYKDKGAREVASRFNRLQRAMSNTAGVKALTGSMAGFAKNLAGTVAAIGSVVGAAVLLQKTMSGVKDAFDLGGRLSDLSTRTGETAGNLAALEQAFKNNGMAAEQVGPMLNRLQKALTGVNEEGEPTNAAIAALGINLADLAKQSPLGQLMSVGNALNNITDPATRATAAMAIFGRSGGQMLTLFADTTAVSTAMSELGEQVTILNSKAGVFDTISDKLANMVPAKLQGFFVGMADSLTTPLLAALDRLESAELATIGQRAGAGVVDVVNAAIRFQQIFGDAWTGAQAAAADVVATMISLGDEVYDALWRAGKVLEAGFWAAASVSNSLISVMTEGLAALALDFQTGLQFAFAKAAEFFDSVMGPIVDSISAGLQFALEKMMEGVGKIPLIGKQAGLDGFSAQSFDSIMAGRAADRQSRRGGPVKSYGEMREENFKNSEMLKGMMDYSRDAAEFAKEQMEKAAKAIADSVSSANQEIMPGAAEGARLVAAEKRAIAEQIGQTELFQFNPSPTKIEPTVGANSTATAAPELATGNRRGRQFGTSGQLLRNADGTLTGAAQQSRGLGTISESLGSSLTEENKNRLADSLKTGNEAPLGSMLPGAKKPDPTDPGDVSANPSQSRPKDPIKAVEKAIQTAAKKQESDNKEQIQRLENIEKSMNKAWNN